MNPPPPTTGKSWIGFMGSLRSAVLAKEDHRAEKGYESDRGKTSSTKESRKTIVPRNLPAGESVTGGVDHG